MSRFFILVLSLSFVSSGTLQAQGVVSGDQYALNSVLAQGIWHKIGLRDEGIYRLDYSQLAEMGFTGPEEPRIYGNSFGQLSFYNRDLRPDDLVEIPVFISRGSDGVFNAGDYLLFFSHSVNRWANDSGYTFNKHHYSDSAFYFITTKPGPNSGMSTMPAPQSAPAQFTSQSDQLYIHENDVENIIKSGREWYQPVSATSPVTIKPGFGVIAPGDTLNYRIRIAARGQLATSFRLSEGGTVRANLLVPEVNIYSTTGTYARPVLSEGKYVPSANDPSFEVSFHANGDPQAKGWLDYLQVIARVNNRFKGPHLIISDKRILTNGSVTRYSAETGGASNLMVWDITNSQNPQIIQHVINGGTIQWDAVSDTARRYVVFNLQSAGRPVVFKKIVPNQDIHSLRNAEMIIITHPLFEKYASKVAEIHRTNSGLESVIVTPEMIYNEFSGGVPDINAIRNFIRMVWLRGQTADRPLRYLLLFGDGSIDNKILPPKNPNFIPTYQTQSSTIIVSSFMSDDFYGLLDIHEGEAEGYLDLGIGRLPVNDTTQAGIIVAKIERYISDPEKGAWKNIISLVADDEDFNIHMSDAEGLSNALSSGNPWINIEKIYLDSYRQVSSASGHSYPDATMAISDRVNTGAMIVNYLGHGNELGLAHERVIKTETINSWRNKNRLPLFITATCEFSRFDDVELNTTTGDKIPKSSAGEMVLLNPNGGGIALLTTTRIVYSAPNYTLNKNLYNYAFEIDSLGNALRLGDIMRLAKVNSGGGTNKRNFSLLGDPALRITFPWNGKVITDSINGIYVSQPKDTLKALSLVTISGHVEDNNGNYDNDFTGVLHITLYDKPDQVRTLANDGGTPFVFNSLSNILFKGKTDVLNGRFRTTFLIPRDINFTYGNGKVSYFAEGTTGVKRGSFHDAIVGGFSDPGISDTLGPDISIYFNDTLFREGGITDNNPRLLAFIYDQGGINTTGNGIGHDLVATLDGDASSSIILNSYFEADLNSYTSGKVSYNLPSLTHGQHSLTLKAWDNYNNSSEEKITFFVRDDDEPLLSSIINFPNPFSEGTSFSAEHNMSDQELSITVSVYNNLGEVITIIRNQQYSVGYKLPPIYWDGTDSRGARVASGLYFYRILVKGENSKEATATGKLIIL